MSLSPRPETVRTTKSSGLNAIFGNVPKACELSNAGMMPSKRVNKNAASNASSSLTANTFARRFSAKLACIGPIPG